MPTEVVVVVGAGSIGQAIAQRQGSGRTILLASRNPDTLAESARTVEACGHVVETHPVDVAELASVEGLVEKAASMGDVVNVIHTAGLSPVQASAEAVLKVDLYGAAVVLEEFAKVIAPGGAGLVVSSQAGHMFPPLPPEQERALAMTPAKELLDLPFLSADAVPNSAVAYGIAKRANTLRVRAAATTWGDRGARVNSISPGIILTPLAKDEMSGPGSEGYRQMLTESPAGRWGTTDEIAEAAALLLDNGFITGADLLIDGGVVAAIYAGRIQLGA